MVSLNRRQATVSAALARVYAATHPYRVISAFAFDLLTQVQLKNPPFDPREYARALGLAIQYRDIATEGVLDESSPKPVIWLKEPKRSAFSTLRKRENFTIAHEIGHFIIRRSLRGFVPESIFRVYQPDEERLCNIFAEKLLMPKSTLTHHLEQYGITPESFLKLSDLYDVSLQALIVRVASLYNGNLVGALWNCEKGLYRVKWTSTKLLKSALLCDTGKTTVERALRNCASYSGKDVVLVNGKKMYWPSISRRLPNSSSVLSLMKRGKALPAVAQAKGEMPRRGAYQPVQSVLPLSFGEK